MYVRSLISEGREEQTLSTLFEAKDMANPHPNTGINKLRDAIRKAKPSIKSKYQQLTTDGTQRESFTNHFLTAMVRLFDEQESAEKEKSKTQAEKDYDKKSETDSEREKFGAGVEGDSTGRNQAFDAFNLVQTYFSDAYLDLNNPEDQEMYKKWGLYNIKLLLDKYEEELNSNPTAPNIEDPT